MHRQQRTINEGIHVTHEFYFIFQFIKKLSLRGVVIFEYVLTC